jgi:hypothetical protein
MSLVRIFPVMRRAPSAGWSNRLACAFIRFIVVLILGVVLLGVYFAVGGSNTLRDALMLLVLGSMMGYFAQVFGDFTGAYSRVAVLNHVIHLYSMLFLPVAGVFVVSRIVVGAYKEAGASTVGALLFLAIYCAARTARLQRDASGMEIGVAAAAAAA